MSTLPYPPTPREKTDCNYSRSLDTSYKNYSALDKVLGICMGLAYVKVLAYVRMVSGA